MTTTTYLIPVEAKDAFIKVFNRAVKKAVKLGVEPMTYTIGNAVQTEIVVRGRRTGRYVTDLPVTIVGTNPSLNGWKLTAVISPLKTDSGEVLPMVTVVPGETVSDSRNTTDPLKCDHCGLRRDRLETFVVLHEDGTERQVGKNCLADFLGGAAKNAPAALANLAGLRTELDEAVRSFAKGTRTFFSDSLQTVFAVTVSVLRTHPWVSVGQAQKTGAMSTKVRVSDVMGVMSAHPTEDNFETPAEYLAAVTRWELSYDADLRAMIPTAADHTKAQSLLEVVAVYLDGEEEKGGLSDYLASCRVILAARTANRRAFGIACSMVPMAQKQLGELSVDPLIAMAQKARETSQFVGTLGKRQTFTATLTDLIRGPEWTIRVFVTNDGNILKTFTAVEAQRGDVVTFKATPTKHAEFKSVKETVVNRVAVV